MERTPQAKLGSGHKTEPGIEGRLADHDHEPVFHTSALLQAPRNQRRPDALPLAIRRNGHRCQGQSRLPSNNGDRAETNMTNHAASDDRNERPCQRAGPTQVFHQIGLGGTRESGTNDFPNAGDVPLSL